MGLWEAISNYFKRDRLAEMVAMFNEVKYLKEAYRRSVERLQEKEAEITKELDEIKESEIRCMQRLVDVNERVRDLEEEVIVLRDWQNNRPA